MLLGHKPEEVHYSDGGLFNAAMLSFSLGAALCLGVSVLYRIPDTKPVYSAR